MSNDDLTVMERQYMRLALMEPLSAAQVSVMCFYQSLFRDFKREWFEDCRDVQRPLYEEVRA